MQKKQLTFVIVSLLLVVLSVSLAYFTTQIIAKRKDVSLTSTNLQIVFKDSDGAISGSDIEPGWSDTKTFTVQNKSKSEYKYNIVIKDLINTFVTEGYLQYKITSTNNGYNMTDYVDVPKSTTVTDTILAKNVSIAVNKIQTYTIEFRYVNDEDVDQSDDMGKVLKGTLFITEDSTLTLAEKLLEDNPTVSERTDFSTPFTTNTTNTLYKAKEDNTDVYYFTGIDGVAAHCEVEGITGDLLKFTDGYNTDLNGIEAVDEDTCKTKSLCNLSDSDMVLFDLTQTQCQELAENQMGYYEESIYSDDLTNRTWVTELNKSINNWVKFGKNSSGVDLYWRIIRTNSDGSIRLLYHSTSTTATDAYIGPSKFNSTYNDSMYVGYMYGTSGSLEDNRTNISDSTIKTTIDKWYKINMTSYTKYLSTSAVYCNDREVGSGTYSAKGSLFYYASHTRLDTNQAPTYDCTNVNDKFTVDSSAGNGKLTYPIALMTSDEIIYAGGVSSISISGVSGISISMWYYTNSSFESSTGSENWWSLSPRYWNGSSASAFIVFNSSLPGHLYWRNVDSTYGVRPVISLKSCIKYSTGNGTYETPYEIVETSSGC